MDPREQRGLLIAATTQLTKDKGLWSVPSQSGHGQYLVNVFEDGSHVHCACPDFEARGIPCKHIHAVQYTLRRETSKIVEIDTHGNSTITETETVTESVKVTYSQDWPAYNAAQVSEKRVFLKLLNDLCNGVDEPVQTFGRPRLPLGEMIFAAAYKTYSTVSCRRFMSDVADAQEKGYISKLPCYNSIFNYFEMKELTPILQDLIKRSSLPLAELETRFAVDSSGFGSSRFVKWFDVKHGGEVSHHDWVKVHLCCGVQTNIVTSVQITGRDANDSPLLPALVNDTAANFAVREVAADKGYSSRANLEAITSHGASPYIAFKSNANGKGTSRLWNKAWHFYSYNRECFFEHYHKRSNVESTFMMIKSKFGDSLRSKTDVAQTNEALLKVLCHNIVVVIQSIFELGIDPDFCPKSPMVA